MGRGIDSGDPRLGLTVVSEFQDLTKNGDPTSTFERGQRIEG